ncbi:MAG: extracellular solute-binding protein [Chloroflexota bacterium]
MKRVTLVAVVLFVFVVFSGMVSARDAVEITVRCIANVEGGEGWRCDNFAEVEDQVEADPGIEIEMTLVQDSPGWGDYKNELVLASEANEAPDIILSGHEDIGAWAPAGFIISLEDKIGDYPEFEDVVETLWESHSWNGERWAIPQDAEARPIFYSKLLLADLGWSEVEIESLPERVTAGEFTFADILATAEQAIAEGVVEEEKGYYHRPSNGFDFLTYYYGMGGEVMIADGEIVFDTDAALATYELMATLTSSGVTRPDMIGYDWGTMYDEVATAENVMFYKGSTWQWAGWALNQVAEQGGNDYLLENMGLMLFPAMDTGEALTLTHPLSYMISSQSENPDVAMALLAAITTPEANNRHAIDSFHPGILTTQIDSEPYASNKILSGAHYMLDFTTAAPNTPAWNAWSNAYWTGITAAHTGESTPEEAVELAVAQLTNELGDEVTIR